MWKSKNVVTLCNDYFAVGRAYRKKDVINVRYIDRVLLPDVEIPVSDFENYLKNTPFKVESGLKEFLKE